MCIFEVQRFNDSTIQRFNDSTIQRFNDSTIQRFNDSTIQRFNDSTIGTTPWRLWDGFWDDLNLQNHSVLPSLGRRDGSKGTKGIYPPSWGHRTGLEAACRGGRLIPTQPLTKS